ncbi:hypothetical protein EDD11_000239 [Mortierella claussenii]|nr:hypothetical protein EDD11_000239 [Mortierella claussenii]
MCHGQIDPIAPAPDAALGPPAMGTEDHPRIIFSKESKMAVIPSSAQLMENSFSNAGNTLARRFMIPEYLLPSQSRSPKNTPQFKVDEEKDGGIKSRSQSQPQEHRPGSQHVKGTQRHGHRKRFLEIKAPTLRMIRRKLAPRRFAGDRRDATNPGLLDTLVGGLAPPQPNADSPTTPPKQSTSEPASSTNAPATQSELAPAVTPAPTTSSSPQVSLDINNGPTSNSPSGLPATSAAPTPQPSPGLGSDQPSGAAPPLDNRPSDGLNESGNSTGTSPTLRAKPLNLGPTDSGSNDNHGNSDGSQLPGYGGSGNNSTGNNDGSSVMTTEETTVHNMGAIIGAIVGSAVLAVVIGVWVFRKWKLSPSYQFKSKISGGATMQNGAGCLSTHSTNPIVGAGAATAIGGNGTTLDGSVHDEMSEYNHNNSGYGNVIRPQPTGLVGGISSAQMEAMAAASAMSSPAAAYQPAHHNPYAYQQEYPYQQQHQDYQDYHPHHQGYGQEYPQDHQQGYSQDYYPQQQQQQHQQPQEYIVPQQQQQQQHSQSPQQHAYQHHMSMSSHTDSVAGYGQYQQPTFVGNAVPGPSGGAASGGSPPPSRGGRNVHSYGSEDYTQNDQFLRELRE